MVALDRALFGQLLDDVLDELHLGQELRQAARHDRTDAAADRDASAEDRLAASDDRFAALRDREQSAIEREQADYLPHDHAPQGASRSGQTSPALDEGLLADQARRAVDGSSTRVAASRDRLTGANHDPDPTPSGTGNEAEG